MMNIAIKPYRNKGKNYSEMFGAFVHVDWQTK